MNFKFNVGDRIVCLDWGCGTIIDRKYNRYIDRIMYEMDMDRVKTPKPVKIKDKIYQGKRPTEKASEGSLKLLSEFLNEHKEYGSTYDEIITNLRAKWEHEHELNRFRREGYVTDLGEYI